jgi:hypothetical protein
MVNLLFLKQIEKQNPVQAGFSFFRVSALERADLHSTFPQRIARQPQKVWPFVYTQPQAT